jgi:hypothetical protein
LHAIVLHLRKIGIKIKEENPNLLFSSPYDFAQKWTQKFQIKISGASTISLKSPCQIS